MCKIFYGTYKDVDGIVLENSELRAILLPQSGSKIASIMYKPREAELLWQESDAKFPKSEYGQPFGRAQSFGFDEMFPTINACRYAGGVWDGVPLPDHGEVWSLPWHYEIEGERLRLWVYGVRLPYLLEKTVALNDNTLTIEYAVTNLSPFPLDYLWAAHPLFNLTPGARLLLPPAMTKILNAYSGEPLRDYGRLYDFPAATLDDGRVVDLATLAAPDGVGRQKYYFAAPLSEGWCGLRDPGRNLAIRLSFPPEVVRYLGIWFNQGWWEQQYNVALEPATAAMDQPDLAKARNMSSTLPPHGKHAWFLRLAVKESPKK